MTIIRELKNPITPKYVELKQYILDLGFPWYNAGGTVHDKLEDGQSDFDLFVHPFLQRPTHEVMFTSPVSRYAELAARVVGEILLSNRIYPATFYRICANLVTEKEGVSPKHVDHNFPHQNVIVYLNDFDGGDLIVYDESNTKHKHTPEVDKPVVFDGNYFHQHEAATTGKRFALVATFLELDPNLVSD